MSDDELTTRPLGPVPTLDLSGVELVVVDGEGSSRRHAVTQARVRIGTSPHSDLQLRDPAVSRFHCEIRLRSDGARIVDTHSTNGTFVDGVRIFEAMLAPGATVRVGGTSIRVEFDDRELHLPISRLDRFGPLLGGSLEMRRLYSILERIAGTESTVLIGGETGTGKELVARAIHEASRRADGPFVVVDCGALAEHLVESELFGHVRGAFTGAQADRKGLLEHAKGGTLLLDEVGELALPMQPKLLRALETREVRRVGSNESRPIDVRVLAATHRPLDRAVNEGAFREDLYYRLAVVEVLLPALRARRTDLPLLASHFYERFAGHPGPVPDALLAALATKSWAGNVRELRNFVERWVSLGVGSGAPDDAKSATEPAHDPDAPVPVELPLREARAAWAERFEGVYVRALLARVGGNVTRAAEMAGVNRRTMQRMIAAVTARRLTPEDEDPA